MSKTKKRSFKEIRQRANEIIKRPPTAEQLEELKNAFVRIEQGNEKAQREEKEQTAVGKLRERFFRIRDSIKPSKELVETFRKKEKTPPDG